MNHLQTHTHNYLEYCQHQKRLDSKTLKAYRIDLRQFSSQISNMDVADITPYILEDYISGLHQQYKPKTAKRKIASIKAFFHYLKYRDLITQNPFNKIQVKFREPVILPKTIPLNAVEMLLSAIYKQYSDAKTDYQKRNALRDAAVIELLFATGIRLATRYRINLSAERSTDTLPLPPQNCTLHPNAAAHLRHQPFGSRCGYPYNQTPKKRFSSINDSASFCY